MKLLFCLFHYFPYGGLQRDCVRIAKACMDAGDHVEIVTQTWEGPQIEGIPVHCFPVKAWTNFGQCEKFAKKVLAFTQTHHYDGVIGFNKMPGLDIYYAADPCYRAKKNLLPWWPRDRVYLKLEETVFSPTQQTQIFLINPKQQAIFSHYYHTQQARFHLLPPGIDKSRRVADVAQSQREALRKSHGINTHEKIILFLASGFKAKGLDRAIIAFAQLPLGIQKNTYLWIAGQDNIAPYQRLIKQYHLSHQVKYLGASDQVPELLMMADLLLHPAYKELAGMVLLEALVAGLPVLTTDVCGYAHYVQSTGAGVVLPEPFSQSTLNNTLTELLSGSQLLQLRKKAEDFSQVAQVYDMPEVAVSLIHQHMPVVSSASLLAANKTP